MRFFTGTLNFVLIRPLIHFFEAKFLVFLREKNLRQKSHGLSRKLNRDTHGQDVIFLNETQIIERRSKYYERTSSFVHDVKT